MKQLNDEPIRPGYDEKAYISRLGKVVRYVIARPDFYIFAIAANLQELGKRSLALRRIVEEGVIVGNL